MSEKRFIVGETLRDYYQIKCEKKDYSRVLAPNTVARLLNEQQELIEELQVSDEMGWKRAERFEKKCPKELNNKKMYIKRLEYKVQKFKEENEQLKKELKWKREEIKALIEESERDE